MSAQRGETSGAGAATQPARFTAQLETYAAAMRLFHRGEYSRARDLFIEAAAGADRGIANRAQLYITMCHRRIGLQEDSPASAEEHYNLGVALLNQRELESARTHLEVALQLDGKADHAYYALALCLGLAGDLHGAYENLKSAIELQPRNRIAACQDADFAPLVHQPPLDRLLHPDRK